MSANSELKRAIRRRDALMRKNNEIARKNPRFARMLRASRSQDSRVLNGMCGRSVAGCHGMGSPYLIGGLAVGGVVGLAALAFVYWQIKREERLYAQENPIFATVNAAKNSMFAVMGIGGIALAGFVYYDRFMAPKGRR